jgi:hypothetical protein
MCPSSSPVLGVAQLHRRAAAALRSGAVHRQVVAEARGEQLRPQLGVPGLVEVLQRGQRVADRQALHDRAVERSASGCRPRSCRRTAAGRTSRCAPRCRGPSAGSASAGSGRCRGCRRGPSARRRRACSARELEARRRARERCARARARARRCRAPASGSISATGIGRFLPDALEHADQAALTAAEASALTECGCLASACTTASASSSPSRTKALKTIAAALVASSRAISVPRAFSCSILRWRRGSRAARR